MKEETGPVSRPVLLCPLLKRLLSVTPNSVHLGYYYFKNTFHYFNYFVHIVPECSDQLLFVPDLLQRIDLTKAINSDVTARMDGLLKSFHQTLLVMMHNDKASDDASGYRKLQGTQRC